MRDELYNGGLVWSRRGRGYIKHADQIQAKWAGVSTGIDPVVSYKVNSGPGRQDFYWLLTYISCLKLKIVLFWHLRSLIVWLSRFYWPCNAQKKMNMVIMIKRRAVVDIDLMKTLRVWRFVLLGQLLINNLSFISVCAEHSGYLQGILDNKWKILHLCAYIFSTLLPRCASNFFKNIL